MSLSDTIQVAAVAEHLKEHSDPDLCRYAFGYTVTIRNSGRTAVRLLNRHWIITDANGSEHTVDGKGVIGEQPLIQPGRSFRYTSGTLLSTPVGSMRGSYEMVDADGNLFTATIPAFRLAMPELVN